MENESKIIGMSKEFNPMTRKNTWRIEYSDNFIEEKYLPLFIDKCYKCWKFVNVKTDNCLCGAPSCNDCKKECEEKKICLLK